MAFSTNRASSLAPEPTSRPSQNLGLQLLHRLYQRQLSALRALEQHAGGKQPIDFVGAFENAIDARIAIGAFDHVILMIAVAAVDLDAFVGHIIQHLGREDFDVGTLRRELLHRFQFRLSRVGLLPGKTFQMAFNEPCYPIRRCFRGEDPDGHFGQLVLDQSEFGDRFAEGFAFLRVVQARRAALPLRRRTANAPSFKRPIFRILNAMMCPRPISPRTFSTGTGTLSR